METNEWAARTFYFLFRQIDMLPDGKGKDQLAKLLLEAPKSVIDEAAELIIEMEKTNGQSDG
jgi:hypothetical protein